MNIGFDGKRAANNQTGLGNYSRWLIDSCAKHYPQNQYFVYAPKVNKTSAILEFLMNKNIHLRLPKHSKFKFLWRSIFMKNDLRIDEVALYHGLSQEIPFGISKFNLKTIVTIHDLIFLRLPTLYALPDRLIYNLKCKYACNHSNRIIAISEKTKNDVIEFYGIEESKIDVIYQSCDDSFKADADPVFKKDVRLKYGLPEQYILNVGTIEPRKNLLLIIRALKRINNQYKLVVVGKKRHKYAKLVCQEISKLGLTDRVVFLNNVPFSDLPSIYQMAALFVYPSFYEGFGIPIIEALHSKIPVIAALGSCLEEAGGPDSVYIDPNDASGLAIAANEILESPVKRKYMVDTGNNFVRKFDSERLTGQVMACYLNTISNNKNESSEY